MKNSAAENWEMARIINDRKDHHLPHEIHITGEMRLSGPLTEEKLTASAVQVWHTLPEREKIKADLLSTLDKLVQRGTVFKWDDGRYYLKPKAAGAAPVAEPLAEKPEGNKMATAEKKKRGRPAKATNNEAQAEATNGDGDEKEDDASPAEGRYKDLETDGEVSDAMAIAENEAAKAKSELELAEAARRIVVAKRDYAILIREHLKISEGATVDEIRVAQKEVDEAEKAVVKASAERREARAAYDAVNEKISQVLNRKLPLFD